MIAATCDSCGFSDSDDEDVEVHTYHLLKKKPNDDEWTALMEDFELCEACFSTLYSNLQVQFDGPASGSEVKA